MVPYLQRRFGLHRDLSLVSPKEQQIVLLNRDEVEAALQAAGVRSAQNPLEADAF
jgi:phage baseplate assembly protein gpV